MLAFKEMLINPAKHAGISIPDNLDCFDSTSYPHWVVFCAIQLGSSMPQPTSHWHNAKVIADVNDDDITKVTLTELEELGLQLGYPNP